MNPMVETHIQNLRWISELERFLARGREHIARCTDDQEAQAIIRMVDGVLDKARSDFGVINAVPQRASSAGSNARRLNDIRRRTTTEA